MTADPIITLRTIDGKTVRRYAYHPQDRPPLPYHFPGGTDEWLTTETSWEAGGECWVRNLFTGERFSYEIMRQWFLEFIERLPDRFRPTPMVEDLPGVPLVAYDSFRGQPLRSVPTLDSPIP